MSKLEVIRRAHSDLLFFGRLVTPTMFTVKSAPFQQDIAEKLLDDSIRLLNIQVSRGHAKSSIAAGLKPLHHIVYDPGTKFIVLVSKTRDHSAKLLQTIKDVIEYSDNFRSLYGYWGRHKANTWGKFEVELIDPRTGDRTYILCRGAAQQMRGLKFLNQRPTLVVYDDPEDEENTKTEESRANNVKGLTKGIIPGLDAKRGRAVLIGTPIHAQGLVNMMETDPRFVNVKYHALRLKDDPENTTFVPRREDAHLYDALWPEMWPVEKLIAEFEASDARGRPSEFYSEYQVTITGDKDQIFPEESFRYWKGDLKRDLNGEAYLEVSAMGRELAAFEKPIKIPVNIFMGVDPASSTSNKADYSVVFAIAVDVEFRIFCLGYFRKRVKPLQLADEIAARFRRYRPKKTQIESVGYQEMLRQYMRERVPEYIPGLEIKNNPRREKTERLESLQPDFAEGRVFIQPHMTDFMNELALFPRGKNDDTIDAYYYARKGAYRPFHDVVEHATEQERRFESFDWMCDV